MDKNKICEAMYALPGGVVVKRRKPVLIPALLLVTGIALVVLNNVYKEIFSADLRSAIIFIGGILTVAGLFTLLGRIFSSGGAPFHKDNHCFLHYQELFFEQGMRQQIVECVDNGNVQRLLGMKQARVPSVAVAVYHTHDNRFAVMQAYEYADLEYKPLSEMKIISA